MFSHLDADASAIQLHISDQTQQTEGARGQSTKTVQGDSKESLSPSLGSRGAAASLSNAVRGNRLSARPWEPLRELGRWLGGEGERVP